MSNFESIYYKLFGAVAHAVEYLEQGQAERAKEHLISAMQKAEEQYWEDEEKDSPV